MIFRAIGWDCPGRSRRLFIVAMLNSALFTRRGLTVARNCPWCWCSLVVVSFHLHLSMLPFAAIKSVVGSMRFGMILLRFTCYWRPRMVSAGTSSFLRIYFRIASGVYFPLMDADSEE